MWVSGTTMFYLSGTSRKSPGWEPSERVRKGAGGGCRGEIGSGR